MCFQQALLSCQKLSVYLHIYLFMYISIYLIHRSIDQSIHVFLSIHRTKKHSLAVRPYFSFFLRQEHRKTIYKQTTPQRASSQHHLLPTFPFPLSGAERKHNNNILVFLQETEESILVMLHMYFITVRNTNVVKDMNL